MSVFKLLRHIKPYWWAVLLAPLLMVLEVGMDLIQPILVARVVDEGIAQGDLSLVISTGLLMLALAFIGMLGGIGCSVFAAIGSQGFGAIVRSKTYRKVQDFSFANLDQFRTSSLITRLTNDVTQVQNILNMALRMLVRAPFLGIGGIVMAVSINPRLSLVLVGALPFMAVAIAIVVTKGFPLFRIVQQKLDRVNVVMRENLSGVRVVKAFVRGNHERKRFNSANEGLRDATMRASRIAVLVMPVVMLVMNLTVIAILWFGGLQVDADTMQVGQIIAFINYMTQILFSLMMVAFMMVMTSRAKASADRVNEVLDTDIDIKDHPDAKPFEIRDGLVEFENVTFAYDDDAEPVLRNVSFRAEPGQSVAILGGTGSGKTTLVSLIMRLYDPQDGRILIDGRDIRTMNLRSLRSQVSIVLQEALLFSESVKANIRWGRETASDSEVEEAAREAQAHSFVESLSAGYDTRLEQRAVNLSGGQKQRLAIARALVKRAPILIMDDSTSAVDMGTESRIQKALLEREHKATTFVIAQRIGSVMDADTILVLDEGEVAARGTHEELLETSSIYQEIYESQMGEGDVSYG